MSPVLPTFMVLCATLSCQAPLELLGRLDGRLIPEASGIVKSRRYPGIYWVHNDSGNPSLIFAIRGDGRIVRQFRLEVPNIDWEDIAIDDTVISTWETSATTPGYCRSTQSTGSMSRTRGRPRARR